MYTGTTTDVLGKENIIKTDTRIEDIRAFIKSEIELAKKEERKRITNGITDIFIEADQREDRVELSDIEKLITNNE